MIKLIGSLTLLLCSNAIYADDLMQVYRQALNSDPTFRKAQADWLSAKENLPIAMSGNGTAGSGLFPNVDLSGNVNRTYQRYSIRSAVNSGYYNGNEYTMTITQPVFNYQTWKSISSARYSVRSATATYLAAAQDLMVRVAQAYFNVLQANDILRFTIAQKEQYLHQLITSKQKFEVGLIAITGVYDAQASYDSSVAQEINDRNTLQDQLENLRAITGKEYTSLKGLRDEIPLITPKPNNIEDWVTIAQNQNYQIKSNEFSVLTNKELIKEAAAGRYPQLNLIGEYDVTNQGSVTTAADDIPNANTTTSGVELTMDFPIIQGGYINNSTKQAEYNYLSASDALEIAERSVVNQTRQAFLGIESGINQIKADEQSIISSRNQLDATEAGYVVGTRTMVDVLDAVSDLYQSQQTWATDRYSYILNIVSLKQQAGTLSPNDLNEINTWLDKSLTFSLKQPSVGTHDSPKVTTLGNVKQITSGISTTTYSNKDLTITRPRAYTIQVYADDNLAAATAFLNKQPPTLQSQLKIMKVTYHKETWYKVVYGEYKTNELAKEALNHLPTFVTTSQPWVTPIEGDAQFITPKAPKSTTPAAPLTIPASTPALPQPTPSQHTTLQLPMPGHANLS